VRLLSLSSVDSHNWSTRGHLPFLVWGEVGDVPKSEAEGSADLRDEADRITLLRVRWRIFSVVRVVLVWPDDKEVVVEPRAGGTCHMCGDGPHHLAVAEGRNYPCDPAIGLGESMSRSSNDGAIYGQTGPLPTINLNRAC
jgi:hypothetical protein